MDLATVAYDAETGQQRWWARYEHTAIPYYQRPLPVGSWNVRRTWPSPSTARMPSSPGPASGRTIATTTPRWPTRCRRRRDGSARLQVPAAGLELSISGRYRAGVPAGGGGRRWWLPPEALVQHTEGPLREAGRPGRRWSGENGKPAHEPGLDRSRARVRQSRPFQAAQPLADPPPRESPGVSCSGRRDGSPSARWRGSVDFVAPRLSHRRHPRRREP